MRSQGKGRGGLVRIFHVRFASLCCLCVPRVYTRVHTWGNVCRTVTELGVLIVILNINGRYDDVHSYTRVRHSTRVLRNIPARAYDLGSGN